MITALQIYLAIGVLYEAMAWLRLKKEVSIHLYRSAKKGDASAARMLREKSGWKIHFIYAITFCWVVAVWPWHIFDWIKSWKNP